MGRPGLTKHRKFKRLAHALEPVLPGMGELLARGCLETIWESAYETGNDYVGTAEDVESLAGWQGKRGLLCGAMEAAGFLDPLDEDAARYRVHDLYDHAPEYVRKRMDREAARRDRGVTLSEVRAAAVRVRWEKRKQAATNGSQLQAPKSAAVDVAPVIQKEAACIGHYSMVTPTSIQTATNGTTPAPAPSDLLQKEDLAHVTAAEAALDLFGQPPSAHPLKPPRKPRKRKTDNPMPEGCVTREQAEEAIAASSRGRYLSPGRTVKGTLALDAARRANPDGAIFKRVGEWLAAGGDGFKGTMDGRSLHCLTAWIAQSQAWNGKPIPVKPSNGNGRPPEPTSGVPDAAETRRRAEAARAEYEAEMAKVKKISGGEASS